MITIPILFSKKMKQAITAGYKTQTRRLAITQNPPCQAGQVLKVIEKKGPAKIYLKVTNVRMEPLVNISNTDALSEGISFEPRFFEAANPKESFLELWNHRHRRLHSFTNPDVWVIEFEKIAKPYDSLSRN